MRFPALIPTLIGLTLVAGIAVTATPSADQLNASTARSLIQTILGSDFKKDQVVVKSIKSASGDTPIVEAQVETAYRFSRDGRGWKVAEVRLGDRHWESVELVDEAIRREKARRTQALLDRIGEGALWIGQAGFVCHRRRLYRRILG